jgi:hypothetical protein
MELLKYTQNIQEVYEALNLIYNGSIREDYAGALNLLRTNPLTHELIPKDVYHFIIESAKIQEQIQKQIGNADYSPTATNHEGQLRTDIKAREQYGYSSGYAYDIEKM